MRASDFVESYFEAWNLHDPRAVADHLATGGIYRDVPENTQRTHDELIVALTEFFEAFPHRYELIGEILASENTIAYQYRMCPLAAAEGGKAARSVRGAEFITLHGDAAISIVDYYDIPGSERPAHLARAMSPERRGSKYAKSGLDHDRMLEYMSRLADLMQTEQVYLRADLTLPRLARELDCSVNHLSQVINAGFGKSFFDYVNQFRIEHAKSLLAALGGQSVVLNIAYTVGFNSNSAFYAAFKKYVGMTPAQYRRSQLPDPH
jgi:AraC-like DNA-binding protein